MPICAPNPFGCCGGSRLLKGGYSYWPLWWYGQRDELPDMSGHGVTLYPSGAYFDGQGYYFDGNDDYLIDDDGRKVLQDGTAGSWHSIYLTEGAVPAKGSIWGTGTKLVLNTSGIAPRITGKMVLRPAYCPNLTYFGCWHNSLTFADFSGLSTLKFLYCQYQYVLSEFKIDSLTSIETIFCHWDNLTALDVGGLTTLKTLYCYENSISLLDTSALTSLTNLRCQNNSMNQEMVDTVLCDMDSHGTSNGTLNISGNEAPSATGVACKDNLVARGWSVTTD